jgi:hypothetical protein
MTGADAQAKALAALLRRLAEQFPAPQAADEPGAAAGEAHDSHRQPDRSPRPASPRRPAPLPTLSIDPSEPVLAEFVWSFLLWESTTAKAAAAARRIAAGVVDFNELRVCLPGDTLRMLGERYPRGAERARRLRSALAAIYQRHHAVTLEHLSQLPKREARAFLESLGDVPSFVSARVLLHSLGGHAVPVDSRLADLLAQAGVVPAGCDPDSAASSLERRIRAADALEVSRLLQAWSDHEPTVTAPSNGSADAHRPAPSSRGTRLPGGRPGKAGGRL